MTVMEGKNEENERSYQEMQGVEKGYRGLREHAKLGLLSCIHCLFIWSETDSSPADLVFGFHLDLAPTTPCCPMVLPETLLCLQQIGSAH